MTDDGHQHGRHEHGRHRHQPSAAERRRVRQWSALTVVVLGVLAVAVFTHRSADPQTGPAAASRRSAMEFGVLGGSCEPRQLAAERAAGLTLVEFDLGWDRYEPRQGKVDGDYVREVKGKLAACRKAGMRVILSLGLQSPPAWALGLAGGRLLDQHGKPPAQGGLDLVFSAAVRQAVTRYVERIADDVGFDGVTAVRLGTNGGGELGYPGPDEGSDPDGHAYWGFGLAAQRGTGLADGMTATPLRGWVPGQQTVSADQVAAWFSWYSRSLVQAVGWQADLLRHAGFPGDLHVPVAGSGAFPSDLAAAVAGGLDGRNDPMGALERGLDYPAQFAVLAELDQRLRKQTPDHGIVVDFTGLDDTTSTLARKATPPQDACLPGDVDVVAGDTDVTGWSGQRFTIATARANGLPVIGENPGPPDAPSTGGGPDSDTLAQQLAQATAYARECGLQAFLFGFERDLFDASSGVTLQDYAREIARR